MSQGSNKAPAFTVRKVAVLGAGVMGAQIAAHLTNAQVKTVLFDLPAKEGDKNGIVNGALQRLTKLKPAPLASKALVSQIQAANYEDDLEELKDCDVIIEAIAERMEWKKDLYDKVEDYVAPHAIFATNTSGLSINDLSTVLPKSLLSRFCGVHFFNPPRYMHLAEIIPCNHTEAGVLDNLESFLTKTLGKGVIRAKDTPNFLANRIGVFSMLSVLHHTEEQDLTIDTVDALTGSKIGRAKSATFRTSDIVGLDTFGHVVGTMTKNLPDSPWAEHYSLPTWFTNLVEAGNLGQKTGAGFFKKQGKEVLRLNLKSGEYEAKDGGMDDEVKAILKDRDWANRIAALRASNSPQAQFLWGHFRDLWHYCAVNVSDIADNVRQLDLANRWGFGSQMGPFETWQAAGWKQVAGWIQEDIDAGKTMGAAALPAWVGEIEGPYSAAGAYSPSESEFQKRSQLPVYDRQCFRDKVIGEEVDTGTTVFEDDSVRCWHQGDDILILTFKSKANAIGAGVLQGTIRAVKEAEANYKGLVLWQGNDAPNFSVGADLSEMLPAFMEGKFDDISAMIDAFHEAGTALKYAQVPTVAAVKGMALGGGCEFQMHCSHTVAALESYIGLVEVGVGLLPAGGGCKELAINAAENAMKAGPKADIFPHIAKAFENVAMAKVATSAIEAKEMGMLKWSDTIVFNAFELLHVAKAKATGMYEGGYRPPLPAQIPVVGRAGIGNIKANLVNMVSGKFISEHDMEIANRIADTICGGDVVSGAVVNEDWLNTLEREHFMALLQNQKSQERIAHMMQFNKPLRN